VISSNVIHHTFLPANSKNKEEKKKKNLGAAFYKGRSGETRAAIVHSNSNPQTAPKNSVEIGSGHSGRNSIK
jgi:hypothetical protein